MTNIALVALACGLIIGLGAIGACLVSPSWVPSTLNPPLASPS